MSVYLWSCAARSDRGVKRENNEDNFYLDGVYLPEGEQSAETTVMPSPLTAGVLAVFDGMGGLGAGEKAAFIAAGAIDGYRAAFKTCRDGERAKLLAESYIAEANRKISGAGEQNGCRMGTTVAALIFRGQTAHALNMGDSRIYLRRGRKLERLSRDHTLADFLAARGELGAEQSERDPRRSALTRFLGGVGGSRDDRPHFVPQIRVMRGDRFLLCSDGLTDMLSEDELSYVLKKAPSPRAAVDNLTQAAIKAGGNDNVTALCAFVDARIL